MKPDKVLHLRVTNASSVTEDQPTCVCGQSPFALPEHEIWLPCDASGNVHASVLAHMIGNAENQLVSPSGAFYRTCSLCFAGTI